MYIVPKVLIRYQFIINYQSQAKRNSCSSLLKIRAYSMFHMVSSMSATSQVRIAFLYLIDIHKLEPTYANSPFTASNTWSLVKYLEMKRSSNLWYTVAMTLVPMNQKKTDWLTPMIKTYSPDLRLAFLTIKGKSWDLLNEVHWICNLSTSSLLWSLFSISLPGLSLLSQKYIGFPDFWTESSSFLTELIPGSIFIIVTLEVISDM